MFSPQNDYYLKEHLFGDIFAGDLLTPQDREVLTVAALSALKGAEPQLLYRTVDGKVFKQYTTDLPEWAKALID